MAIHVNNLSFSFDAQTILKDVSFSVSKGEFVGIIGPNGGGKTTLLKLLMGFLKPSSGKISISGKIGYVPQAQRVDKDFPITVKELVLLGAVSQTNFWGKYPEDVQIEANYLMQKLGLEEHKEKIFGSLSGGLAQKALLARALLSNPDILFLDEPTANVDAASTSMILEMLLSLKGKKTILMVTHDLRTIVEKVDRVLCVQNQITSFLPETICEHFALGLYHTPLVNTPKDHFNQKEHDALCIH
jgi:zinc transport system ATP-binding protein